MRRWPSFFDRRWQAAAGAVVVAVTAASEAVAFDWDEARRWLPDMIAGLSLVAAGAAVARVRRASGVLLMATGIAWFTANLLPAALYWHRGFLVHSLAVAASRRPLPRSRWAVVVGGYALGIVPPLGHNDRWTIVFGAAVVAAGVAGNRGGQWWSREAAIVLGAATLVASVTVSGALVRLLDPSGVMVVPFQHAYEAAIVGASLLLTWGFRPPRLEAVADLVVDLGESQSSGTREALASALGDPLIEIGMAQGDGGFVDARGTALTLPDGNGDRAVTWLFADTTATAVLIHHRRLLRDPKLARAVATVAGLTVRHAELTADVAARLAELTASRRRLLTAADSERERLQIQLGESVVTRLMEAGALLDQAHQSSFGALADRVRETLGELDHAHDDLAVIAGGLHPRELADSLNTALSALAQRSVPPARLTAADIEVPDDVARAVYFVCAELLANVAKHANAAAVSVDVTRMPDALLLVVSDDGRGGADPAHGTGLVGVADRVHALGGRMHVDSLLGGGTRVVAEVPLGDPLDVPAR